MQRWWQSLRDFFYGERVRLPTCSFCERSYTKAGPFVEGVSGHMVCGDCLQQIAENMPEERVPSPQTESRQTGVIASECGQPDSPYRTPSSSKQITRCVHFVRPASRGSRHRKSAPPGFAQPALSARLKSLTMHWRIANRVSEAGV